MSLQISPAREAAYRILRRVAFSRDLAVDLLQKPRVSALREVDRRLLMELVMGVLRWQGDLDFRIEQLSGKPLNYFDPEVTIALRLGIYQIRFLHRIPKSAVVNEAVELVKAGRKRSAAGLVNAVLHKCAAPERPAAGTRTWQPDREASEAALRSLPPWLRERWTRNFGQSATAALAWACASPPRTTFRVCVGEREEVRRQLEQEGIRTQAGRYASQALVLEFGRPQSSALWRQGRVVIQDEASQIVGTLARPEPGQRVLDLCAAPGLKTAQLAAALGSGTLVASDLSLRRLQAMKKRLPGQLPGNVRCYIVQQDAAGELALGVKFDRILLDVPCSGTGTLSRNPEIKWRLQPNDLVRLAEIQIRMLQNALGLLAPGGRLVYVTCSLEPEENEGVVERVLGSIQEFRLLTGSELWSEFPSWSSSFDMQGYFRTRPDLHSMDGFFAAVIVSSRYR